MGARPYPCGGPPLSSDKENTGPWDSKPISASVSKPTSTDVVAMEGLGVELRRKVEDLVAIDRVAQGQTTGTEYTRAELMRRLRRKDSMVARIWEP